MAVLYRIHQRLLVDSARGRYIGPGCVHPLGMLSADGRAVLLQQGAVSAVQAPPLDTFTGWAGRARKLDSLGIDTIGFITMEPRNVAYAIRASVGRDERFDEKVDKLAVAVQRWQHEIREALGIGDATKRN